LVFKVLLSPWTVYPTYSNKRFSKHIIFKTNSAIKEVLIEMNSEAPPLLAYLEERGISLKDLINTALELFVPHPGLDTEEKAAEMLREEFLDALSDVNVSCLEVACFRAQEDAENGLIPGLSKERFMGRPGLVADELLGLAIANYIAGVKGIFEFTRFDQAKPGILKKLGPITNDAIGGLVAGVSSNVYTRAFRNAK
jgi:alpha-ribazole phosphatase CobZ